VTAAAKPRSHRGSYLKTVVGALVVAVAAFAVAVSLLMAGSVRVPVLGWVLLDSRAAATALALVLVLGGLVFTMIAVGGLFALHEDAKEDRIPAPAHRP